MSYYCVLFVQPVSFKDSWDAAVQRSWASQLEQTLTLLSAAIYLLLSIRRYRAYQRWLSNNVSFREEFRILWVRNFLLAFSLILFVWVGFAVYDRLVRSLNYIEEFPLYIAFTLFVYYLGLGGWRHSDDPFPHENTTNTGGQRDSFVSAAPMSPATLPAPPNTLPQANAPDWNEMGRRWLDQIKQRELWRDPDLTLTALAREVGTNTAYVSKALNDGLGQAKSPEPSLISASGLKQDVALLRSAFERLHPGLLRYQTAQHSADSFDQLARDLSHDLSQREVYLRLAIFNATLRCGHRGLSKSPPSTPRTQSAYRASPLPGDAAWSIATVVRL